jgi:hypothetical protein
MVGRQLAVTPLDVTRGFCLQALDIVVSSALVSLTGENVQPLIIGISELEDRNADMVCHMCHFSYTCPNPDAMGVHLLHTRWWWS